MTMDKFEQFLKDNAPKAPSAPANEFSMILQKIEDNKSLWDLMKEVLTNKPVWASSLLTATAAMILVINIQSYYQSEDNSLDEALTVSSSMYTEDLSFNDNEFLD